MLPKDYDGLRKFYSQFESKDQESVVLGSGSGVDGCGNARRARCPYAIKIARLSSSAE